LEEDAVQNEGNVENTLENYGLGFTGWQKTQQTMKSQDVSILDKNFRAFIFYILYFYILYNNFN
jgi:hypothetical protein